MPTEDKMKTLICHKSIGLSSLTTLCLGSSCTAFRAVDLIVPVEEEPGIVTARVVPGAASYCADLKNDPWPEPTP